MSPGLLKAGLLAVLLATALLLTGCGAGMDPSLQPGLDSTPVADANLEPAAEGYLFADDADASLARQAFVEDELLVQPYPGAASAPLAEVYAEAGAEAVKEIEELQLAVLRVSGGDIESAACVLDASGLIEEVHKNYIFTPEATPDDPLFAAQWYLENISIEEAWEQTRGSDEIVIAVVDTGVDAEHPDLAERIIAGWNVHDENDDFDDVYGHGTRVAGVLAAAADNRTGVAGITWDCPVLAVRATDEDGLATSADLAAGILWATSQGARVINVSFAPLWSNRVVRAAAQSAYRRGALVVISAGNGGGSTTARGYSEALFVGAVDSDDGLAAFSDRGPFVDLVAPGVGIYTTGVGDTYPAVTGTSFAAPVVAGVAALAWSLNPDLRPSWISNALTESAYDLGERGWDDEYGAGVVDAAAAVGAVAWLQSTEDDTAPTVEFTQPSAGARLSGRAFVSVEAGDDEGVAEVVLSIDDVPFATDLRAPYWFVLDTSLFDAGRHVLGVVATDTAGNTSRADTVSVTFASGSSSSSGSGASSIDFDSPPSRSYVSGDVTIQAFISDPDGLATLEWWVDDAPGFVGAVSGESAGVSFRWNASEAAKGKHTIKLIVTDALGNQTTGQLVLYRR